MKLLSQQRLTIFLISIIFFSTNVSAIEITPLVGHRNGGEFVDTDTDITHTIEGSDMYGLIIGWPLDKSHDMEIYYSHQSSKLKSVNVTLPTFSNTTESNELWHMANTALASGRIDEGVMLLEFALYKSSEQDSGLSLRIRAQLDKLNPYINKQ